MPSPSTPVNLLMTVLTIFCSTIATRAQGPLPPTEPEVASASAIAASNAEQPTPSSTASTDAPAVRGRWGGGVGIIRLGGTATFDYTNSPTPRAGASGPYTGAVLAVKNVGPGFIFSGGYRGPFHAGSRVGFGFDGEFGGGGGHPADKEVTGRSPSGAQVTFSTERGGIIDLVTAGGGGHVSYNLARRVNVMGGMKVSSLRVKPAFGSYRGPISTPGVTNFLAQQGDQSPRIWRTAATPWAGAELFLSGHLSVEASASFQPGKTEHLADTPWILTSQRHTNWLSASMRIFR